ncbi:hypothetical protein [Methylobacterium brachiatum]|uniref:hypothetical protein n=1 Tax=Methylobacterium brachiatum TaxID=269660 RepID=UPI0008E1D833|nr:hypothetical protein [Methylobacterium brachiatum]SFI84174.1 hypothetical protein SAMN02799642_02870 [Methylobacterium brachiatum]
MPSFTTTACAAARYTLQVHVEELRAELASVLSRSERRQIEREFRAAQARLAGLTA